MRSAWRRIAFGTLLIILGAGAAPAPGVAQNVLWNRQEGGPGVDEATAVAADSAGAYAVGYTEGGLEGSPPGRRAGYLRRYDVNGNALSLFRFSGVGDLFVGSGVSMTFEDNPAGDTISRASGSWIVDGFRVGGVIQVLSSAGNDGIYRIVALAAAVLTVEAFGGGDAGLITFAGDTGAGVRQFTATEATAVAADSSGVYIGGRTTGRFFGRPNLGSNDAILMKVDASGDTLWTRQFGTALSDRIEGIAVDGTTGNIYACGRASGALPPRKTEATLHLVPLGLPPNVKFTCVLDPFLLSLDYTPGDTIQITNAGIEPVTLELRDPFGAAFISVVVPPYGVQTSVIPANAASLKLIHPDCLWTINLNEGAGSFLAKYDPNGNALWIRQFGMNASDEALDVAVDPTGAAYVVGCTFGVLPGNSAFGGLRDNFIVKFHSNGAQLWARQFGTAGEDFSAGVDATASDVYVGGSVQGSAYPGFVGEGMRDAFVRRYDAAGNLKWTGQFGSPSNDNVNDVVVDDEGVFVVGDAGNISPSFVGGATDAYVRRYDKAGAEVFTRQFGTSEIDVAHGASLAGERLYLAGSTDGTLPGETRFNPGVDAFVAQVVPDVNLRIAQFASAPVIPIGQPGLGDSIVVWITNTTLTPITTDFTVGLYVSTNDVVDPTDPADFLVDRVTIEPALLPAGGFGQDTLTVSFNANSLPPGVPTGNVFLGVYVDDTFQVPENSEGDNDDIVSIFIPDDGDGDGVPDSIDLCPGEDASGFDRDGDGCIDLFASGRHIEYWSNDDFPIPYRIHENGAPGITDGSDTLAIQAGVEAWQAIPNTDLVAQFEGFTSQADGQALDGLNLVTFEDPDFVFPAGVLAVGLTTSFTAPTTFMGQPVRPGQIVDADILFNPSEDFSTSTQGTGADIEGVTVHEAGHLFGISHSARQTATMFYVLPPGIEARTFTREDSLMFLKAYVDSAGLWQGIRGTVTNGQTSNPVPGAIVFVTDATQGDTVGCDYTLPDGSYSFWLPSGDYYVSIYPLNGTSPIGFISPLNVNQLILNTAETVFVPELWNLGESATDDPTLQDAVTISPFSFVQVDFITNIDDTPPFVTAIMPDSNVTNVAIDAAVSITFNEPIDDASIGGNFSVTDTLNNVFVLGNALPTKDDSSLVFFPAGNLDYDTVYRLWLGSGLTDLFGNGLAGGDFAYHFRTQPAPPVSFTTISPSEGPGGTIVTVTGEGFDGAVPSNNFIDFTSSGGVPPVVTTPTAATATQLTVVVPKGLPFGATNVTVTSGASSFSVPGAFNVTSANQVAKGFEFEDVPLGAVPRSLKVLPGNAHAFVATGAGVSVVAVDPGSPDFKTVTPVGGISGGTDELDVTPDGATVYAVSRLDGQLYRINAMPTAPFQALNTIAIANGPRGIVIDPAGRRAFVPTDGGEIEIWDVKPSSGTYESQIGTILPPDPGIRGKMAITPGGDRLLALSATAGLMIFDLGPDTLKAQVPVGSDPRDVTTDPTGQFAYVSDATGFVSVVSLSTYNNVAAVSTGGGLRGLDVTPGGAFLGVVNRELNLLHFVELRETMADFRQVTESLELRLNPIDVEIASDGAYAYSLSAAEQSLVITAIGAGAELSTLSPIAGPEGAYVVLGGAGFEADSLTEVEFQDASGAALVVAPSRTADSSLTVTVPAGAVSGPVTVLTTDLSGLTSRSNTRFFTVLGSTPAGSVRLAAAFAGVPDPLLQNGGGGLRMSPTGEFLVTGDEDGAIHLFDIDPSSPTQYQYYGSISLGIEQDDIGVTPDGNRVFVEQSAPGLIHVYDVNRLSPTFLSLLGSVDFTGFSIAIQGVRVSPDGRLLAVTGGSRVFLIDIVPDSPTAYDIIQVVDLSGGTSNGDAWDPEWHPAGQLLYLPVRDVVAPTLLVVDADPASPTFAQIMRERPLPSTGKIPVSVDVTPEGNRAFILTGPPGGADRMLLVYDATVATNPVLLDTIPFGTSSTTTDEYVRVSPFGDRVVINIIEDGLYRVDINPTSPGLYQVIDQYSLNDIAPYQFEYTPGGSRIAVASADRDSLFILDFSAAQAISIASGDNQTAIAGERLAAPLRVQVSTASGGSVDAVPVTFSVSAGGGVFPTTGLATQTVSTDVNGVAEVTYQAGATIGANSQTVQVSSVGLGGSPLTFNATTIQDPDSLPLVLSTVIPADGATGVNITTAVLTAFSRSVDTTTVDGSTYFLQLGGGGGSVPTVTGYADQNRHLSLTPVTPLRPDTLYEIHVTAGVLDEKGGALQNPVVSTFRTAPPPPLVLTGVNPPSAITNVIVVLSGTGFSAVASDNTVLFNNEVAQITEAGEDFLDVRVPLDATSGDIRVVVGPDTSSAIPFTVLTPSPTPAADLFEEVGTSSATRAVAITFDGRYAYAVSPDANTVIPVELDALSSLSSVAVGDNPFAIAMHPDGDRGYVANLLDGTVNVIGVNEGLPDFNTVLDTIPVGDAPVDLAITPDGDRLVVANFGSDDVSVIDTDNLSSTFHEVVTSSKTGTGTRNLAIVPDGSRIYVGTGDGYVVLDGLSYAVVSSSKGGTDTRQLVITPDGSLLILLTMQGDVLIYDIAPGSPTENQVVTSSKTGTGTRLLSIAPDGALVYLIQDGTDEIIVISLDPTNSVSVINPGAQEPEPLIQITYVDTIRTGEDPSGIAFAPDGSGRFVVTNAGDNTITVFDSGLAPVVADIKVTPRTLNTKSRGRFVAANIELEPPFLPQDIDRSAVFLAPTVLGGDSIPIVPDAWLIVDRDEDGIDELEVQFDRVAFQDVIPEGEFVPVHVSGRVGSRRFLGTDIIRTLRPTVKTPAGGTTVVGGSATLVSWESPQGVRIDAVDVYWTADDGVEWLPIAVQIPDAGAINWVPTFGVGSDCRIMVTLHRDGEDIGSGMSPEPFSLQSAVPVALAAFTVSSDQRSALIKWATGFEVGFDGFHILRADYEVGPYDRVTEGMIRAQGRVTGASYEFRDETVRPNQTYFYKLEEVTADGTAGELFGPFKFVYRAPFALEQNVPNPFNPSTMIEFTVAKDAFVRLDIFDVAGRRVRTLVNGQKRANHYEVVWDGNDANGRGVASGVYFYRLEAGKFRDTKKMIMLK